MLTGAESCPNVVNCSENIIKFNFFSAFLETGNSFIADKTRDAFMQMQHLAWLAPKDADPRMSYHAELAALAYSNGCTGFANVGAIFCMH